MDNPHISVDVLERYYLGMVQDEEALAPLEEHLLWCQPCVARAEETQDYVDWLRALIVDAGYGPEWWERT